MATSTWRHRTSPPAPKCLSMPSTDSRSAQHVGHPDSRASRLMALCISTRETRSWPAKVFRSRRASACIAVGVGASPRVPRYPRHIGSSG
eukprot:scaffold259_cov252-Pinguiococcus_pyrenoidosus.AAC.21